MKSIFWRKIPCECEGKSVECWEKRSLSESARLLFLIPLAWIAMMCDWCGLGDVFSLDYDEE